MKDNRLIIGILVTGLFFSPVGSLFGTSTDIGSLHAEEQLSADSPPAKLKAKLAEIDKRINEAPSAKLYAAKANVLAFLNDYQRALQAINKAINLSPNTGKYYAYRGLILSILGDTNKTIEDIEKAKSLGYVDSDYLGVLALAQTDKNDYSNALLNAEAALKEDRNNFSALYARGKVRIFQKKFSNALNDLNLAIQSEKRYPGVFEERAFVWEKLGNKKNASADKASAEKLKLRLKK